MTSLRAIVERTLIAGASVLAALGGSELVLRAGLVSNPLSRRLAASGSRDPSASRVLLIGDSFVYKGGRLDSLLTEALGQAGAQVVNVAVPGAGPLQYEAALDAFGARVHPRLVLLSVFAGNDITDMMTDPSGRRSLWSELHGWLRPRLWRLSLYHLVNAVRAEVTERRALGAAIAALPAGMDPELASLARQGRVSAFLLAAPADRKRTFFGDNLLLDRPESRRTFVELTHILERMDRVTHKLGADFVIVVFPDATQLGDSRAAWWRRLGYVVDDRISKQPVLQRELRHWANDHGVHIIDLLPAFSTRSVDDLYLPMDVHLNDAGDALAARMLTDSIVAILGQKGAGEALARPRP